MHNRQRGAAHVPIIFFILVLVLFLGAVGWAYSVANQNAELTQKVTQRDADAAVKIGRAHV